MSIWLSRQVICVAIYQLSPNWVAWSISLIEFMLTTKFMFFSRLCQSSVHSPCFFGLFNHTSLMKFSLALLLINSDIVSSIMLSVYREGKGGVFWCNIVLHNASCSVFLILLFLFVKQKNVSVKVGLSFLVTAKNRRKEKYHSFFV